MLQRVSMHRSIARLEAFYESDERFYIVMEYVGGGELFKRLAESGPYSEADAASVLREVASALALLHGQGLCHRDIKPENLLLTEDGEVKLVDFGLTGESSPKAKMGTWEYWPPEQFDRDARGDGKAIDMWALGIVAYVMLCGFHPFDPFAVASDKQLQRAIAVGVAEFPEDVWSERSAAALELVSGLLRRQPEQRLTVEQMLQHPWLTSGGAPVAPMPNSDERLRAYDARTARLRAAIFATILQQRAASGYDAEGYDDDTRAGRGRPATSGNAAHAAAPRDATTPSAAKEGTAAAVGAKLGLEGEILAPAFRVFDPEARDEQPHSRSSTPHAHARVTAHQSCPSRRPRPRPHPSLWRVAACRRARGSSHSTTSRACSRKTWACATPPTTTCARCSPRRPPPTARGAGWPMATTSA